MSITTKESEWLELRDNMGPAHKQAIDQALNYLQTSLRMSGLKCTHDDREAHLEAALVRYVFESNPDLLDLAKRNLNGMKP